MPTAIRMVNGKPTVVGTDTADDLRPSVPEEETKPKPKPKGKGKGKPKPKNPVQQLQNDLLYEFNQLRKNPIGHALMRLDAFAPSGPSMNPVSVADKQAMVGVAGAADNIQRMGYSMWQYVQKRPQADPSKGAVGQLIDAQADTTYRLLGQTPPSQMTRRERDVDMLRRSVALNAMLSAIPGGKALQATTKLGGAVKGGLAFGLGEAASQYLDDNTGGGAVDMFNMIPGVNLPGGLGDKAGQLDPIEAANATFAGNVAAGAAIGATVGLASRLLPGTMRWLRGNRLKAEEVEAQGRLKTAGVLEDAGDGATLPGPAVAAAAPQKPATFAEADAAMRQRLGEPAAADPDAATRAELAQVEERLAQLQREGPAPAGSEPLAEVLGVGADPRVIGRPDVYSDVQRWLAQRETEVNPRDQAAYEQWLLNNQQIRGIPSQQMEPGGPVLDADRPLGEFDPALDPWADFDPELPEATDVLKTLDQLDPAAIRAMDQADGSITEMVEQAQQAAQQGFRVNPMMRMDLVAAPTDKLGRLYLEGSGQIEGWDRLLESETVRADALRSLAHPSNSPQLTARIESLTGKEWEEFTLGDIREGLRAMSREGLTVIPERLSGQEFMATADLKRDPVRFQYKQGINEKGEQLGASLSEEEFWNPKAEGVAEVWDDPADGQTYMGNGHNRMALAEKLGIPSLPITRITATKASAARAFGAISNIAQGQGNAFDAAKFIRESGLTTPEQLKQAGMTGERSWARDGLALSRLPDDLYRSAVDGDISLRKAVIIGESGLPEPGMRMLAAEVRNNPSIPDWELKEIGAMTGSSPAVKSRQPVLDGMESYGVDEGARAKVRLVRLVEEALRKDAKVFGGVARAAGQLEGKAANTIDRAGSKAVADEANTGLAAFTRLKYQAGEVSDRLTRAAQEIADGAQPGAVARQVADEMPAILQREMDAAMGKAPVAEVNPDQVDLFAPPEQAADAPPPPLTAAQLEEAKMRLVGRALREGEARPNTTPIPELSEGPRVDPSEALADIEARGGIEPDSPAMKALEDELRLVEEQALQDAAARQDAVEAMKDAYGYDELTFEEKKGLGMTEGWEPIENMPKIADMVDRANAEMAQTDANVYRRVGKSIDAQREGLEQLAPAPVKPQPLTLAQAAQPEFTLPDTLTKAAPRYGRFTVAFDSDLDRAAYILQNDLKKPSKAAPAFREAVQAAGLDPAAVAAHGAKVKAAIKEIAKGNSAGQLRVPRQPWGADAPPATTTSRAKVEAEIADTEAQIADIQQRAAKEGC